MFGSPVMSNDLNLPFPSSPFKHQQQGSNNNSNNKDVDPDQLHRQHQMSSNLLRYRSAVLGGGDAAEDFLRATPAGSSEAESMFARFMAPPDHPMGEKQQHAPAANSMDAAPGHHPHMLFQLHHHQQQPAPSMQGLGHPEVGAFGRAMASGGMDHDDHGGGKGGGGASGLVRHSSSPAGLSPHLNVDNGFALMRVGSGGAAGFRPGSNGSERLKTQISFSSRGQGSSFLSQISELGPGGDGSSDEGGGGAGGERCYMQGFPVASWEDSVLLSESFKRGIRDPSELQNGVSVSLAMGGGGGGGAGAAGGPARSLSGDVERYLQFQDAVPCKVRAKRGCATHPRSIAERVRRTRISERIRKLQELVPNMDKQTNTADMLDLAVEYIKDLQRQSKALSENRANCTCGSNGRQQQQQ